VRRSVDAGSKTGDDDDAGRRKGPAELGRDVESRRCRRPRPDEGHRRSDRGSERVPEGEQDRGCSRIRDEAEREPRVAPQQDADPGSLHGAKQRIGAKAPGRLYPSTGERRGRGFALPCPRQRAEVDASRHDRCPGRRGRASLEQACEAGRSHPGQLEQRQGECLLGRAEGDEPRHRASGTVWPPLDHDARAGDSSSTPTRSPAAVATCSSSRRPS